MPCSNGKKTEARRAEAWHHTVRGKPIQNGPVESFNGNLSDKCINEHLFRSCLHARNIVENWRNDKNLSQ
ncbi:integrase core domain-containing protein [Roseibium sp.]